MSGEKAQYGDHYSAVSRNYDSLYSAIGYNPAIIDAISRHLQFSANDIVADIGGGTGEISSFLWKKFNLKNPILCVDPFEAMLESARQKEGIETLKASAEEFFSEYCEGKNFNKILMVACYHHFKDPGQVLEGVSRVLSADGVCLVLGLTSDSAPPLFSRAQEVFSAITPEEIARLAESKGLKAKVTLDCQSYEIEKASCFEFIRNRMFSNLSRFTDDEIEEGVREVAEKYKECEVIKADYKFHTVIITKNSVS